MAKVIKVFKERQHDFKKYEVGDDYPNDNKERVAYLVSKGYLEVEEKADPEEPKTRQRKKKDVGDDADPDA